MFLNHFEIILLVPSSGKDAPRPGASFPLGGIFLSGRLGVVFLGFCGGNGKHRFRTDLWPLGNILLKQQYVIVLQYW